MEKQLPRRILVALVATASLLRACSRESEAKATPQPSATPRVFRSVAPGHGQSMGDLTLDQRSEVDRIQSTLKPEYRNALQYTIAADGRFVVVAPYHQSGKLYSFVVSSCLSPKGPSVHCIHECGSGFVEQFWQLEPLMETGRCQDAAPVWLNAKAKLPIFSVESEKG